jgi:glucose/arabinose dehydrogenase
MDTRRFAALTRALTTRLSRRAALRGIGGAALAAGVGHRPSASLAQEATPAAQRRVDPADIEVPAGYRVEALATGLAYPSDITFGDDGTIYLSETGAHTYGEEPEKAPPARILRLMADGSTEVVYDDNVPFDAIRKASTSSEMPEGLIGPIEGITWHDGKLYVAHRTRYSTLDPRTGEFTTIINDLPAWGIFHNTKAIFDADGKMVFGVSSQGNAGIVDAAMMKVLVPYNKPDKHEIPGEDVELTGQNFLTPIPPPVQDNQDPFGEEDLSKEERKTGAFVPLGTETKPGQVVKGQLICNSGFFRANPDGTNIERIAWGVRNAFEHAFAPDGRLIATNNSGNAIAPREIFNDWETIYEITEGEWYGWPDYYSGVPVTDPRFASTDDKDYQKDPQKHEFLLTEATRKRLLKGRDEPIQPLVRFKPHVASQGFTFGNETFGIPAGELLVAEYGTVQKFLADEAPGHRVSRVNLDTGEATDFLVNKSRQPASVTGGGGLERPLRVRFGPDGALYVVDWGVFHLVPQKKAFPNTGVVWKVTRTD